MFMIYYGMGRPWMSACKRRCARHRTSESLSGLFLDKTRVFSLQGFNQSGRPWEPTASHGYPWIPTVFASKMGG